MSEYIYPTSVHTIEDFDGTFAGHVKRGSVNPGTDYNCGVGTAVLAVKAGRVIDADSTTSGSGGRLIYIDHGDGTRTDYLHLSVIYVGAGQWVEQGQHIADSGASAWDSNSGVGPHLHISLHTPAGNVDIDAILTGGSSSDAGADAEVIEAQQLLNGAGYSLEVDGIHGPGTDADVRDFQSKHGLEVDGRIGPATLAALHAAQPAPPAASGRPTLAIGSTGPDVAELQEFMNRVYPAYSDLAVDADFGPATDAVVREFQSRAGLEVDGIVGPATWGKLGM